MSYERSVRSVYCGLSEIAPVGAAERHVDVLKRGLNRKVVLLPNQYSCLPRKEWLSRTL